MKVCINCGNTIPDDAVFCTLCGANNTPAQNAVSNAPTQASTETPAPNPNMNAAKQPYAPAPNPNMNAPQQPYVPAPNPNMNAPQQPYAPAPNPNMNAPQQPYAPAPNPNMNAPQQPYAPAPNPYVSQDVGKKSPIKLLIIVGVAAVIVILAVWFIYANFISTNASPENVISGLEDVMNSDGDASDAQKILNPYVFEDEYDNNISKIDKKVKDLHKEIQDKIGNDYEISFEVVDSIELKGSELAEIKNSADDKGYKVEEVCKVFVYMKIEDHEKYNTVQNTVVVKIDGKWYMNNDNDMF